MSVHSSLASGEAERSVGRDPDSLPPPAFPSRQGGRPDREGASSPRRTSGPSPRGRRDGGPASPQSTSGDVANDDFLISPDEPLPPRSEVESEASVATGIDNDPHLSVFGEERAAEDEPEPDPVIWWEEPGIADLISVLEGMAKGLRDQGLEGIRITPGMSRAESTLRSYCLGYLTAQAEER